MLRAALALSLSPFVIAAGAAASHAQANAPGGTVSTVLRTEGTDAATGITWVRFTTGSATPSPSLSIECSAHAGSNKRSLDIFYDPSGNPSRSFHVLSHQDNSAVPNPQVRVIMDFPGYKPFKRFWETLPSGEYHLLPPGNNANMEDPRFFVLYMNTVRTLRITSPDGSPVEFSTGGLAQQALGSPLCSR
jgi:hypothetical protein